MLRAVIAALCLLVGVAGGDHGVRNQVPESAITAMSTGDYKQLAIDAFMQVKGVAPGSPGFPWDRVQYVVTRGDITPSDGPEVIVGGTVLPEDGFLVIYGQEQGALQVQAVWDGLARIEEVRCTSVAPKSEANSHQQPQDLAIGHSYDEMLGALFRWRRLLYLQYVNGALRPLLELVTLDEAYSLEPPYAERALLSEEVVTEKVGAVKTAWEVRRWQKRTALQYQLIEHRSGETWFVWNPQEARLAPLPGSTRP